ncbi:hypothetical protein J5N97_009703 [Dioscorea zingiberensis]|uniref:Uncharacterized protein n=1 Tax=Dioscorea zingiberensis TaxID=325984 RepID=A0A9D5CY16_9LILI|nr:hypothetical protein J5N97_009703 [Dioscorea zingiberensis]
MKTLTLMHRPHSPISVLLIGTRELERAGQERFRTLTSSYYRGAQVIILAGQERFRTLTSSYYRGAQVIILDSHSFSCKFSCDQLVHHIEKLPANCFRELSISIFTWILVHEFNLCYASVLMCFKSRLDPLFQFMIRFLLKGEVWDALIILDVANVDNPEGCLDVIGIYSLKAVSKQLAGRPNGTFKRVVKKKPTEDFNWMPYTTTLFSTSFWSFYRL